MKQQIHRFTGAVLALALTLGLGLTALPAWAAEETPQRGVITYTEVIAPEYEAVENFSDGLAAVKKDGKWGFADTGGSVVIDFQYDDVHDFSDGLAPVKKDRMWGFIDHNNNVVVDFQYDRAYEFSEGKSVVHAFEDIEHTDGNWYFDAGFVSVDGTYTPFECPEKYERFRGPYFILANGGKYSGGIIGFDMASDFGVPVYLYNSSGELISTSDARITNEPNEGLIPTQYLEYETWKNLGGWMDMDGNIVHQYKVEFFGPGETVEGYWGVTTTQSYRHIYWVGPFTGGMAPAIEATYNAETDEYTELMGFIDRATFDWIPGLEPQFESYAYAFGDNYGPLALFVNGLAMVTKDGKRGAIDKRGNTVIPFQYELSLTVAEGRIAFQQDGKWGYLSAAAPYEVVIPAQYERVTMFHNGLAAAYDGTDAFLIDWYGNRVPGMDTLDPSVYFEDDGIVHTPGEYVIIKRDGKYGIGHIEFLPDLPEKTQMDDWAYDEVVEAIEEDLVPVDLQNLYHNDITRIEFCRVAVQTVEATLGQDIAGVVKEKTGRSLSDWQNEYPFNDTTSRDVIAAYALGIINGYGNGRFAPNSRISRQEAAVMLSRVAKLVGVDTTGVEGTVFTDGDKTADWATEAMNFVSHYGIMQGIGNDTFDPHGTYTREQSYMTVLRLFQTAEQ